MTSDYDKLLTSWDECRGKLIAAEDEVFRSRRALAPTTLTCAAHMLRECAHQIEALSVGYGEEQMKGIAARLDAAVVFLTAVPAVSTDARVAELTSERDSWQETARQLALTEASLRADLAEAFVQDSAVRVDNESLRNWRATVTTALQREGGAHFADVPDHIRALVGTAKRYAELADAVVGPDRLSVEDRDFWTHEMTVCEAEEGRQETARPLEIENASLRAEIAAAHADVRATEARANTAETQLSDAMAVAGNLHAANLKRIELQKILNHSMDLDRRKTMELNVLVKENRALFDKLKKAREAISIIVRGFDKGVFVRSTERDQNPKWAIELLPYIQALQALHEEGQSK